MSQRGRGADDVEAIALAASARDPDLGLQVASELARLCLTELAEHPDVSASDLVDRCLASGEYLDISFVVQVAVETVTMMAARRSDIPSPKQD